MSASTVNELSGTDMIAVLDSILPDKRSLISHHLDSFNYFVTTGIKQIMQHTFVIAVEMNNDRDQTAEDRSIDKYVAEARILDVHISSPSSVNFDTQKAQVLYPCEAHRKDLTYSSPIHVDVEVICKAYKKDGTVMEKSEMVHNHRIGSIPIMVGSKLCNTSSLTREQLLKLNEDPTDMGGYFIIKSVEWIVDNIESMTYNLPREFKTVGYKNELARSDIISKPGDNFENSSQIVCKLLNNGNLIFEINNNRFKQIVFPFYVLFRAFGVCDDKSIIESITYSLSQDDPVVERMSSLLEKALMSKYSGYPDAYELHSQMQILETISHQINDFAMSSISSASRAMLNTRKYSVNTVLSILDKDILPHVGLTPDDRYNKTRFLGHMLHRLLLVHLDIIPSTDRDSYKNKRVNPAGVSYGKLFKTNLNIAIVQKVRHQIMKDLRSTPFSNLRLAHSFETAVYGYEFERTLMQGITTGDKMIKVGKRSIQNQASSQQLHRKNPITVISALRNINTKNTSSAKQSERANEMRRVHPSTIGYVCVIQSADTGEKVGMQKQMAISTRITLGSSSVVLKDIVRADPMLIPMTHEGGVLANSEIFSRKLTKVFVNGDWIGCCSNYAEFTTKYRKMRREGQIHYITTIAMDVRTNEIYMWTDIGRIVRPLIIVYSNEEEFIASGNTIEFKQYIKLTKDHILGLKTGRLTCEDLLDDGVIEFISPEEQQNCLLAEDIETFVSNASNPLLRFTHLDIPQAIVGIPGLTSPFTNHNQPARGIFQTNQVKQACGVPCLNYPYKVYKEMFVQVYNQKPLVKTVANKYIPPIGMNAIVAVMLYGGYNQDDSLIINKGAVDRGLFTTHHFTFEKTELDKNEEFATPDPSLTTDMKAYSNYGKLVNGIVPEGTFVESGDVIIGKICKLSKGDQYDNYKYYDKSITYKYDEPARVWSVIRGRNEDDSLFCKIVFESVRKVEIGNKFCLTGEHDVLTSAGWKPITELSMEDELAVLDGDELRYEQPECLSSFAIGDDQLYNVYNQGCSFTCTLNHKLLVKEENDWKLQCARDVMDEPYTVRRHCVNAQPDTEVDDELFTTFKPEGSRLPTIVWKMSATQCERMLDCIVKGNCFSTYSHSLADDVQRLAIHCGYSADITTHKSGLVTVSVIKTQDKLEPIVNTTAGFMVKRIGFVYCPTVSTGVFMARKDGKACWTGNSSRSGQKGTTGMLYRDSDMPYTADGIRPDIIFNPHSLPSRMTMGVLLEGMNAKVNAKRGTITDATIFNKVDIDDIADDLEKLGYNRNGTERLYTGITGNFIDVEIFIGPVYYQCLQKFTIDSAYAYRTCPTDATTRQPLDGRSASGGLRLGEYENWVMGFVSPNFLHEKTHEHSDGYTIYVCRNCHNRAIVNKQKRIYKCTRCGDAADIVSVESTWTAKLLMDELASSNVGMRLYTKQNTFQTE